MKSRTPVSQASLQRYPGGMSDVDLLAVEEPLQIQIEHGGSITDLAVTMRTPGHDLELATGLLFSEGIISRLDEIMHIRHCENVPPESAGNVVKVTLNKEVEFNSQKHQRSFYASSSCGVCGKTNIDDIRVSCSPLDDHSLFKAKMIIDAVSGLAEHQDIFSRTGGLHACAAVSSDGTQTLLREDIGRHNALDKLIGALLGKGAIPMSDSFLVLSGRASFEMIQKAARAGFPLVAAIGAPSSLAAELSESMNQTLLGFVRNGNFNIYSGAQRINE